MENENEIKIGPDGSEYKYCYEHEVLDICYGCVGCPYGDYVNQQLEEYAELREKLSK